MRYGRGILTSDICRFLLILQIFLVLANFNKASLLCSTTRIVSLRLGERLQFN